MPIRHPTSPACLQGCKTTSQVNTESKAEHALLRKAFSPMFNTENVTLVVEQLAEELQAVCDHMARQAARESTITTDVSHDMTKVLDTVYRRVRHATPL